MFHFSSFQTILPGNLLRLLSKKTPLSQTHMISRKKKKKRSLPIVTIFVGIRMCGGYSARNCTQDSRHTVQIVHATSVMSFRVLGQEWLRM